jgi:hypothetical protein
MLTISKKILGMLERLAEMFPSQHYQSRLEEYLKDKSITDAAQLEHYVKQFELRKGVEL